VLRASVPPRRHAKGSYILLGSLCDLTPAWVLVVPTMIIGYLLNGSRILIRSVRLECNLRDSYQGGCKWPPMSPAHPASEPTLLTGSLAPHAYVDAKCAWSRGSVCTDEGCLVEMLNLSDNRYGLALAVLALVMHFHYGWVLNQPRCMGIADFCLQQTLPSE
jgi:hypothetical protein